MDGWMDGWMSGEKDRGDIQWRGLKPCPLDWTLAAIYGGALGCSSLLLPSSLLVFYFFLPPPSLYHSPNLMALSTGINLYAMKIKNKTGCHIKNSHKSEDSEGFVTHEMWTGDDNFSHYFDDLQHDVRDYTVNDLRLHLDMDVKDLT